MISTTRSTTPYRTMTSTRFVSSKYFADDTEWRLMSYIIASVSFGIICVELAKLRLEIRMWVCEYKERFKCREDDNCNCADTTEVAAESHENKRPKRKALRRSRNTDVESADLTCWGRLFQTVCCVNTNLDVVKIKLKLIVTVC